MFLGNGVPFLSRKEQPLQCLAYKSMQTSSILLFIFPVKKFSILLLYRFKLIQYHAFNSVINSCTQRW